MRHQVSNAPRWMGGLLFLVLAAAVSGCGKTSKVTGKVTYQGRPVTYGSVIFLNPDKTAQSGAIEPDGSYTIEDVPRGTARIAVISRDPSKGRSIVRGQEPARRATKGAGSQGAAAKGWFPLPSKFEDAKASELSCSVDSGHVMHDIDLK